MAEIHPKGIRGNWKEGFSLDFHTLRSEYIGDDEYGHPQFETTRSEIGELLYRLKYKKDKSVLDEIVTTATEFIKLKNWALDLVVAVPPSRKGRPFSLSRPWQRE
jgi:competence protein ComFC